VIADDRSLLHIVFAHSSVARYDWGRPDLSMARARSSYGAGAGRSACAHTCHSCAKRPHLVLRRRQVGRSPRESEHARAHVCLRPRVRTTTGEAAWYGTSATTIPAKRADPHPPSLPRFVPVPRTLAGPIAPTCDLEGHGVRDGCGSFDAHTSDDLRASVPQGEPLTHHHGAQWHVSRRVRPSWCCRPRDRPTTRRQLSAPRSAASEVLAAHSRVQ
jgi:hypothetical protein